MPPSLVRPAERRVLALTVLAVTALLAYLRLFLAVDLTDEAFYNSLPWSFALGMRPYHEEANITQNAGILLCPFVKVYYWCVGSSEGLVLFNRHLFFGVLSLCAWTAFRAGRAAGGSGTGMLLAALVFGFSYFNIPALSYNTLGALLSFLGCWLMLPGILAPESQPMGAGAALASCLCHMAAAFAYPSLAPASCAGIVVTCWIAMKLGGGMRGALFKACLVAIVLGGACACAFVVAFPPRIIAASIAYAQSYAYSSGQILGKIRSLLLLQSVLLCIAGLILLPGIAAFAAAILARKPPRRWLAFPLGLALILVFLRYLDCFLARRSPTGSTQLISLLGLLCAPALAFAGGLPSRTRLAVVLLPTGFAAAALVSLGSTNGLASATIGLFSPALGFVLVLALMAGREDAAPDIHFRRVWWWQGLAAVLALCLSVSLFERSYRDAPFAGGTPAAASGPYAGIFTQPGKIHCVAWLADTLREASRNHHGLFADEGLPFAYLLTNLRPRTFSTWVFWSKNEETNRQHATQVFGPGAERPDIIVLRRSASFPAHRLLPLDEYPIFKYDAESGIEVRVLGPLTPQQPRR